MDAKEKIFKSDEEWKKMLTPEEYHVLRERGTEQPFTGPLLDTKEPGVYICAACGNELFSSNTKYHSGSGWPSFWEVIEEGQVEVQVDNTLGNTRYEVVCARCESHLGHVFEDGPEPTGKRYCVNSLSLKLKPKSN